MEWKDRVPNTHAPQKTLRIKSIKFLAGILETSPAALLSLAENASQYYRTFKREVKGKERDLVEATGPLKRIQRRILNNVLLRLPPSDVSFGGIKGRSVKDNAQVHVHSSHVAKLDIKAFYPSIRSAKVYEFFIDQECNPDVSRVLTALTTREYALPLGTSTSPALADQIARSLDVRINGIAVRAGLKYTRYVDDITLSGSFPLERLAKTVAKVLRQNGFKAKRSKLVLYGPDDGLSERVITGVAIRDGGVTAPSDYIRTLEDELQHAIAQSRSGIIESNFLPREHYRGKIGYIQWLDRARGDRLLRLYKRVRWRRLEWAMKQM